MDFSFPKKERLKSKKGLQQLFEEGKSISSYPLRLQYLPVVYEDGSKIKVAFAVPKKNFKSAVKRNRIKRLLREGYRLNKPFIFNNTKGQYALVILYLGKDMPAFSMIMDKINVLFKKFLKANSHENTI